MGLRIRAKCDPMVLKQLFFQKITKNRPAARGCDPDPYSLRRVGSPPPDPRQ